MLLTLNPDRCLVIGEIAQAHDGSLGTAHAYIDAIARAGADAVKFQMHMAASESSPSEAWRVHFSAQDKTRYDYWRRTEFAEAQWAGLKQHAEDRGLLFLCSPFSVEAAQVLARLGVHAWKVASGEVTNPLLFDFMLRSELPILLSTGMSTLEEIDSAVRKLRARQRPFAILQCTSSYPCPPEAIGLNLIPLFRNRYACSVGLSDHSGTIYPGLAAVTLGIELLEVHATISREAFGPDVAASVTTAELHQLVEGIRFIEAMRLHPVNKDAEAERLEDMRRLFGKSVITLTNLSPGTVLSEMHLGLRKPATGIPAAQLPELVGRKVKNALSAGQFLREEDLVERALLVHHQGG